MAEVEQRMDAGMDARGRATQGAVAEQLPRAVAEDVVRAAKVRRSAWALALLAAAFYVGFIAWNVLRAPLGG
jgi:hypothetical protein